MTTHRKLSARILSMALSVAMVSTMLPTTVFATEGDIPIGASSINTVGTIKSFDKLEDRFAKSTGTNAPDHVYSLSVALNTPVEDLNLPDELTAMVARTTTVSTPSDAEDVVDSGKPSEPTVDETIPDEDKVVDEDTVTDDTVSDNQPASPSDAEEDVKEEIKDGDVPLAPEPEQDKETTVTTVKTEAVAVTWQSDKEYKSDVNGQFIYTAVLPEGYLLADGVNLPQIYVFVGRQARITPPSEIVVGGTGATSGYETANATTLQKAFTDIADAGTVIIGTTISLGTTEIELEGSKSVTLDLNGNTISGTPNQFKSLFELKSSFSLTLKDSGSNGAISTASGEGNVIENAGIGTLTILSGTITSSAAGATVVFNSATGTVVIAGATLEQTSESASIVISNTAAGTIKVTSGTVENKSNAAVARAIEIEGGGTAIIEGGTITSKCSRNTMGTIYAFNGSVQITGGTISNTANPAGNAVASAGRGLVSISRTPTITGKLYPAALTPGIANANITKSDTQASIAITLNNSPAYTDGLSWKVYTGATGNTEATGITASNAGNVLTLSHSTDIALGDYYIAVDGYSIGKAESERLKVSVVVGPSITIGTQPSSPAAMTYSSVTGSLTVAGTASNSNTVSYQWYKNATNSATGGTAVTGATSASFTIPTTLDVGTHYYYCVLSATDCADKASNVSTVTVNKANATDTMKTVAATVSKNGATGATATLPTRPAAATYGTITYGGTITCSNASVNGDTLTYTAPASTAGATGTITIPVTTATNYNDYSIVVTITSTDKKAATITAAVADKTYNGVAVTQPAPTAVEKDTTIPVTLTYTYKWQKSNGSGGYTDISGNTAPKDAGSYKLVIEGSSDTHAGTTEIAFTINKATVTITAPTKSAYVGDTAPVLSASDCTITGLATGKTLKTAPTLVYNPATPDMSKVGEVVINASGAAVPDGGNYVSASKQGVIPFEY